jgi:hypothetical protein
MIDDPHRVTTICKTCGRPIIILRSEDPQQPIILDGDRCVKEDGGLRVFRHGCDIDDLIQASAGGLGTGR